MTGNETSTSSVGEVHQPASLQLLAESLISFAQAAQLFPPFRRGRPVSPSCIWRWVNYGVKMQGKSVIRLEAIRVAGRHLTSKEAVTRFIAAQQPDEKDGQNRDLTPRKSLRGRRQQSDSALAKLQAMQGKA